MAALKLQVNQHGWLILTLPIAVEERAQEIRRERDARYGNIFMELENDLRWVGEVGEICFNRWLLHSGVTHEWIQEEAAGQPDFRIDSTSIGIKTVKRKVPMRPSYTAQITATHSQELVDHFFFMSYEFHKRKLWMLGGITKNAFLADAKYYAAGDWVHSNYQIRPGHEIYNIPVTKLVPPRQWLSSIT